HRRGLGLNWLFGGRVELDDGGGGVGGGGVRRGGRRGGVGGGRGRWVHVFALRNRRRLARRRHGPGRRHASSGQYRPRRADARTPAANAQRYGADSTGGGQDDPGRRRSSTFHDVASLAWGAPAPSQDRHDRT